MYKLFIADDEPKIRRGLSKMDWGSMGIEVVGEAENGLIALEKVKELKPDIMFVDICMPFINGLELITEIKKILPISIIIIISGHDEFNYAKQAVSLGVFDYILKPVNKKGLLKTVQQAIESLETNLENNQYINWAKYQVRKNKDTIIQQCFYDFINNRLSIDKMIKQLELLNIDCYEFDILFLVKPLDIQNDGRIKLETDLLTFCIENIVQEVIDDYVQPITFHDDSNVIVLMPFLEKDILAHAEQRIKLAISKYLGREVLIEYESLKKDLINLSKVYSDICHKLNLVIQHTPIVLLAKCYIEKKYYKQELSLIEVADELKVSSAYLSRLIKKETGMTFKEYLTKVRIDKAIEFMNNPTIRIYEVAEQVGYSTQHYFSSAFKKVTGVAPNVYRQRKDEIH